MLKRAQTQLLLIVLYGLTGVLSLLAPGLTASLFAIPDADQTAPVLYLVRVFGASALLVALLLFFFLMNFDASRRLMLTLAIYEGVIIAATLLSFVRDDLGGSTTLVVVFGSAVLALLNTWGSFYAERGVTEEG